MCRKFKCYFPIYHLGSQTPHPIRLDLPRERYFLQGISSLLRVFLVWTSRFPFDVREGSKRSLDGTKILVRLGNNHTKTRKRRRKSVSGLGERWLWGPHSPRILNRFFRLWEGTPKTDLGLLRDKERLEKGSGNVLTVTVVCFTHYSESECDKVKERKVWKGLGSIDLPHTSRGAEVRETTWREDTLLFVKCLVRQIGTTCCATIYVLNQNYI